MLNKAFSSLNCIFHCTKNFVTSTLDTSSPYKITNKVTIVTTATDRIIKI